MEAGKLLWEPPAELREQSAMAKFMRAQGHDDYHALWRWSDEDLVGFWRSIWDRYAVGPAPDTVLAAQPGDRILVRPATYGENVVVN